MLALVLNSLNLIVTSYLIVLALGAAGEYGTAERVRLTEPEVSLAYQQ